MRVVIAGRTTSSPESVLNRSWSSSATPSSRAVGSAEELLALGVGRRFGDQPDVAVIDIRMPPTHTNEGLACAATLGIARPELPVLVLSHHLDPSFALQLLSGEVGRRGYLLKDRVTRSDNVSITPSAPRRRRVGHRPGDRRAD